MIRFFENDLYTESGSDVKVIYSSKVNDDGTIELVPSGKEDWQSYIESFAGTVDINYIIARYQNGDMTALNQRNGVFGDFTQMPKTYAEMLQIQINAKDAFDRLPVDVKEKFHNDFNQYLASAGTEEWLDKLGIDMNNYVVKEEKVSDNIQEEVKE